MLLLAILVLSWFGPVVQTNWENGSDAGVLFYTDLEDLEEILNTVDTWMEVSQD